MSYDQANQPKQYEHVPGTMYNYEYDGIPFLVVVRLPCEYLAAVLICVTVTVHTSFAQTQFATEVLRPGVAADVAQDLRQEFLH